VDFDWIDTAVGVVLLGGLASYRGRLAIFYREPRISKLERAYEVFLSVSETCMDLYMAAHGWVFDYQSRADENWKQLQAYRQGLKQIPIGELKMLVQTYGLGLLSDYEDVWRR
jgi:hypothetical protein